MEIKLNIDVESAKADYEIIQKFGRLLEDFDRLRNLILYKEVERRSKQEKSFKDIFDDLIKEGCKDCKEEDESSKIVVKEIKSFDDLKEIIDSLLK